MPSWGRSDRRVVAHTGGCGVRIAPGGSGSWPWPARYLVVFRRRLRAVGLGDRPGAAAPLQQGSAHRSCPSGCRVQALLTDDGDRLTGDRKVSGAGVPMHARRPRPVPRFRSSVSLPRHGAPTRGPWAGAGRGGAGPDCGRLTDPLAVPDCPTSMPGWILGLRTIRGREQYVSDRTTPTQRGQSRVDRGYQMVVPLGHALHAQWPRSWRRAARVLQRRHGPDAQPKAEH